MKTPADTVQDLDEVTGSEQEESGIRDQETKISFPETRLNY